MRIDRDTCQHLATALSREWLETNGLGGYASSTIVGANTRTYHALLVAAMRPPTQRVVLLQKADETVLTSRGEFDLSTSLYHPDTVHPEGYRWLREFRLDPFPVWKFEVPGAQVTKTLFMPHGANAVVIRYQLESSQPITLSVRLMANCRDHHHTTHANSSFGTTVAQREGYLRLRPYDGMPELAVAHNGRFREDGCWFYNYRYPAEWERGLADREDAYSPGVVAFDSAATKSPVILAWTQPYGVEPFDDPAATAEVLERKERERRAGLTRGLNGWTPDAQSLALAADKFIVRRVAASRQEGVGTETNDATVIAGYPWFTDWGRDTLISLPGLTLVTGRFEIARSLLGTFIQHLDHGMVPNVFPEIGETPEYNTIDATLWLVHAMYKYVCYTKDWEFCRQNYEPLREIMRWHVEGTRYRIRVDEDGLLGWDADGVQLTWMDARLGDWVVTPRRGKPVEINALWHNALQVLARFARKFRDAKTRRQAEELAGRCARGFEAFWNAKRGCLFDVLTASGPDAAVRPNQVFAVSLPFPLAREDRAQSIIDVVTRELLTPRGLRTLSREHPDYHPYYGRTPLERDGAYHQGTVWPWLLGPYATALVQANNGSASSRKAAQQALAPLFQHYNEFGLAGIGEVFDAEPPHRPQGCPWQAWSVAELLRAWVEDARARSR